MTEHEFNMMRLKDKLSLMNNTLGFEYMAQRHGKTSDEDFTKRIVGFDELINETLNEAVKIIDECLYKELERTKKKDHNARKVFHARLKLKNAVDNNYALHPDQVKELYKILSEDLELKSSGKDVGE